ncbi:MAG: alanine racemase [Longimicrobiales bacterium]
MSTNPDGRAWMEVDPAALRRNVGRVRASVGPDVGLVPMVKADGYGLGMEEVTATLEGEDPWGFGVATVAEGLVLRAAGSSRRVVVFSPSPPDELEAGVRGGLRVSVSDAATLRHLGALAARGARPVFHLEIDTGMGRAGVDPRRLDGWRPALDEAVAAGARWEGVYTHLHSAEDGPASIRGQVSLFQDTVELLDSPEEVLRHVLNSAGAFHAPELAGHLVRPGIFLYGGAVGADVPAPEAVASVRARVVHVRESVEGDTLGYGSTWVAEGPQRWATVSIGYADGLPRALSNRGSALVAGRRVPIIGRISMDVTVVDISSIPSVSPGQVVTFLGRDGDEVITVDEIAGLAGTISYEILTGFTPRLPRIWGAAGGA